MIIGVDAGALSISDNRLKLGVYWVNVNLLRQLSKIDTKNTYRLYSFMPIDLDFGPRMENRVLRPARGWFSVRLPIELRLHPVDVFLGLSQAIPVSRARNIGFIYDLGFLHYPDAYPSSQKKLTRITADLVKRSDHIVTISHVVKEDMVKHFAQRDVTVAYPGVGEVFTPLGANHKQKNPYFIFVGALKRGKNIPFLLRGFASFLKQVKKPYDLYLVGSDYWLDPQIELKNIAYIKRFGFVPDSKLAELYRGAIAFVSPSLWEGFCLPAVESMACGTPVIGSTTGAFPEIVGSAGILADPHDEKSLTNALIKIAKDKTLRKKLAKAAIRRAKTFSWKKMAHAVYSLL